jgi:basic membrane lipoprotein Med (substrate-binding protein (PBP1-ABC) superfamily)
MAAGSASKTGKLGLLASFPIPEVLRGINAWTLGARAVNPEATVNLVWTNTWFDPALERKTAEALIAEGADTIGVVAQDSPASGEAANAAGVGKRVMNGSNFSTTRETCVCWSISSLTRARYPSRVRRHGRSRAAV